MTAADRDALVADAAEQVVSILLTLPVDDDHVDEVRTDILDRARDLLREQGPHA